MTLWRSTRPHRKAEHVFTPCTITDEGRLSEAASHVSHDTGPARSAWPAARSRGISLSAQSWRLFRLNGKNNAAIAVGHSIHVACWYPLANDYDYGDLGGDWFVCRSDPDKRRDHHIARLQELGFAVTLRQVA